MQTEKIIELAKPYIQKGCLSCKDLDIVYNNLSDDEQDNVAEILFNHNIIVTDQEFNSDDETINFTENPYNSHIEEGAESIEYNTDISITTSEKWYNDYIFKSKSITESNEDLCKSIQKGNSQASQNLCIKNVKLILKFAHKYHNLYNNDLAIDDLVQAGYIGLLEAANRFNIDSKHQFSTYAVYWIRKFMFKEIRDSGFSIRIPEKEFDKIAKVKETYNKYNNLENNSNKRIKLVANELNLEIQNVNSYLSIGDQLSHYYSLNEVISEDEGTERGDLIIDTDNKNLDDVISQKSLSDIISEILDTLNPRHADIIRLRYGIGYDTPKSREDIAKIYNISTERVRQIEKAALNKLKRPSCINLLDGYLNQK